MRSLVNGALTLALIGLIGTMAYMLSATVGWEAHQRTYEPRRCTPDAQEPPPRLDPPRAPKAPRITDLGLDPDLELR